MQNQSPVTPSALLVLFATLGGSATALAQTWSAPGDGNWSVSANWSPSTVPITGNTATLGDTSSNRTVTYDSAASGTVGTLSITQSSAASNSLLVSRSLTVQNAVTLGSSGGTAQINVGSNATTGFQLTSANGITLNQGGVLGLSATTNTGGTGFQAGSLNANTALTISGGTLIALGSTGNNTTAAASNTINGNLSMSAGSISFNNVTGTTADRRLDIRGPVVNITGGSIIADRSSALLQFQSTANTSIILNPASFDSSRVGLNLQSDFVQTLTSNQTLGALSVRGTGVKTLTSTASGNGVGQFTFWDTNSATPNSAATLRLGSNLNLTAGAAQPVVSVTGGHTPESGRIDAAIDTNGFTLDLSAGASGGVWTPPASTQTGVTNTVWSLSGNGSIRANAFNLSTANVTTNIGTGLVLNAAGGNSTASNLGSAGAVNSGSIFRYSGAAATANPATLTFARNIGQVEVSSGALRILSGASGNITGISVSGGTLDLNNATRSVDTLSLTGGTLANGTYSLTSGNFTGLQTGTVTGQLSGTSSLVKNSPGTLTLAGNNNFGLGGSVTVTQGTLAAGHVNAFGSTSVVTVNGGDVDLGGFTINKIFFLGTNGGSITNGSIARTSNTTFTFQSGSLGASLVETGAGVISINKTGNGNLSVSGANSYSGSTTISAGTLTLAGNGTLGSGTLVVSGGTLDLGGKSISNPLGSVNGGSVNNGTIANNGGSYSVQSGSIGVILAGTNGLSKSGNGTVTLNNANTYTGNTTISAGTLAIGSSGSIASSGFIINNGILDVSAVSNYTIGATQTLMGGGSVTGNLAISGVFQPGNSPGVQTISGNLTLNAGAMTTMEIGGTDQGISFDYVMVGGNIVWGGSLDIVNYGGYDIGNLPASYDLFDFTGTQGGNFASVSVAGTSLAYDNGLGAWVGTAGLNNINLSLSDGVLSVSAIPEPSVFATLAGLVALGFAARRRRGV